MTRANGHTPNILGLFLQEDAILSASLKKLDYPVKVVHAVAEAQQALHQYNPDVIIGFGKSAEIAAFFQSAKANCQPRPLLIRLSESDSPENSDSSLGDMVISMGAFQDVIPFALNIWAENRHLERHNHELKDDLKHLKAELQSQQRASTAMELLRKDIVHNVAHELRTPLLQVKSAVALLAEDTTESNKKLVDLAMGATTRLEAVVKNITLLNELMSEGLETRDFEPVLLTEVIDSAIRNLRRSWEHKGKVERIQLDIPQQLPLVWGDKQRLAIAIQLLLDNALKFSQKHVEVKLVSSSGAVDIAIRDYGIGIPKDKIEKIFDTFYQVNSSSTRQFGGMGVGLAIVRYIIEYHKVQIHVETAEGKGSTFSFKLPIVEVSRS